MSSSELVSELASESEISSDNNYLRFNSSASLDSLNNASGNTRYKNTCDIVPSLINHELQRLRSGASIINRKEFNDKTGIYDLVSTIRLVDSKLNHITLIAKAKNILVVTKLYDARPVLDTLELIKYMLGAFPKVELFIQDELMKIKKFTLAEMARKEPQLDIENRIKFWSATSCTYNPNTFDLVITLGGDGTILFTSWLFQELIPPVLSFSLGSLGFLTQFNFLDHQRVLRDIMENGYQCSIRTRFECTVMKSRRHLRNARQKTAREEALDPHKILSSEINKGCSLPKGRLDQKEGKNVKDDSGKPSVDDQPSLCDELKSGKLLEETHRRLFSYSVFNDIVVDRGPNPTMASMDLYSDDELLTNVEADGCVIATPSGSTAYSLSAGGSLVHPEIPGILVSPICPHSLSFRPLVIPESIILRIGVPYEARVSAWCSFDGKNRIELEPGDLITVTASRFPIPFVKNTGSKNEWFKRLSDTLHWNERKRPKPLSYFQ